MKQRVAVCSMMVALGLATVALGACSSSTGQSGSAHVATAQGPRQASQKDAVSTPEAAPVKSNGAMKVVSSDSGQQYLHDLMQQSDFADAFHAMDGAANLPAWVAKGGTATPAKTVTVDGQSRLAAQACKPHDCPSAQIVLLYDKTGHSMRGVFVRDPQPSADAGISKQASFTWLGQPNAAVKAWLKQDLTSR